MKKNILIFSYAYEPLIGGAEIAVKELTARMSAEFSFTLITRRFARAHPRRDTVGAVAVYRVRGGKFLFSFVHFIKKLRCKLITGK